MTKTADLTRRIRKRFAPPAFAVFTEVHAAPGHDERSMDALAVSLWRSRGALQWHGLEVKATRSDWLRELRNPAKADAFAPFVDRWSIVAPKDIVKPEELPEGWGLFVPHGAGLREAVKAKRTPCDIPDSTRGFVASFARRAHEGLEAAVAERMAERGIERDAELEEARAEIRRLKGRKGMGGYETLRRQVEEFEQASGLAIADGWGLRRVGAAIKDLVDHGHTPVEAFLLRQLHTRAKAAEANAKALRAAAELLAGDHPELVDKLVEAATSGKPGTPQS